MSTEKVMFKDFDIIRYPVLTEKSTRLLEQTNSYVFIVDIKSTKEDIKRAIEKVFNVKVKGVNTIISKGKRKLFKGVPGRRADFKKAIVQLEDGNKIDFGTGV